MLVNNMSDRHRISLESNRTVTGKLRRTNYDIDHMILRDRSVRKLVPRNARTIFVTLRNKCNRGNNMRTSLGELNVPCANPKTRADRVTVSGITAGLHLVSSNVPAPTCRLIKRKRSGYTLTFPIIMGPPHSNSDIKLAYPYSRTR